MNFNMPLMRPIRILLFPLSLVYLLVIWIRNKLYDRNILKSASFNLPTICVGNIAVGGTGKSPMVEYLVRLLKGEYEVATLSRGYKRKTKGYALANDQTTALEIGDEPMLFHIKFPDVAVAVGEERIQAIPLLLQDRSATEVIILDDAFQHREVRAGFNIVLTDYSNLYTRDWYLPTGDLRDLKSRSDQAEVIVVTKCPALLGVEEKEKIRRELKPLPFQYVFYSYIRYGRLYHILNTGMHWDIDNNTEVLLVTGIANPAPLKKWLHENASTYYEMTYSDHHIFTIDDLNDINERFNDIKAASRIIITTEKDAVRLVKFEAELHTLPLYVLPIEMEFLFNEGERFNELIRNYIRPFK